MSELINKKAFSMVEMMLLLVIASLIVAASAPIITKRHLHLPSPANHGSYMCYYRDGQLYEARKSGKRDQKMLAGYPRATANCVFEPPAKAMIFQITAIGGGGGGGDAGFTGELPTTNNNPTSKDLRPFGDNTGLTKQDLLNIGVNDNNDAINEVIGYMGHVWAFAQGADSGLAGDIDYTVISKDSKTYDCPVNKIKYKPVEHTKYVSKEATLCKGYDGEKAVTAKTYSCYRENAEGVEEKVGAKLTFGGASATCKKTWTEDKYECQFPNPKEYECEVKYVKQVIKHPPVYKTSGTYTVSTQKTIPGPQIPCPNPCQHLGQKNCNNGPCYGPPTTVTESVEKPCGTGISQCLVTPGAPTEYIYGTKTETCTHPCTNTKIGTVEKSETWTESAPPDVTNGIVSGTGVECREDSSASPGIATLTYYTYEADGCNVTNSYPVINYSKETHSSDYAVGKSPFCTTPSIAGNLGLTYSDNNNLTAYSASQGSHINLGLDALSPHSFCEDLGECGPSVGKDLYSTYATATINSNTIRSYSAEKGATGDTISPTSITVSVFDYADADQIYTKEETYYYDEVNSDGFDGIDGSCSPASGNKPDCRGGNSTRTGYCLQHYGTSENSAELNGYYKYHDTYDINSLGKGLPGEAGEYKTIVVRSLSNINRTITIGRGGSAAALNRGLSGASGSATTFGDILVAEGGAGGAGRQPVIISDHLKTYDGFDYQKLQKCFTTEELNEDEQCIAWKDNPQGIDFYKNTSGDLGYTPTKTVTGGMFSFILASFGKSNDETVRDLLQYAGRGGRGGGVEHFCWAGQYVLRFEDQILKKSSVFWENNIPEGINPSEVPANHKIPVGCATAYRNIPAGAGFDGALIITW